MKSIINELIQMARLSGATDAAIISAKDIPLDDSLAELCKTPGCPNFGLSPGCPPNVSGPDGFRELMERFSSALVVKIEVPSGMLLTQESNEVFQLLHTMVADLERRAMELGCAEAMAFAGGSCKQLFCSAHPDCRVLKEKGHCRNPDRARPSMSGFGIKVAGLLNAAGWEMKQVDRSAGGEGISLGTVAGMVLIRGS